MFLKPKRLSLQTLQHTYVQIWQSGKTRELRTHPILNPLARDNPKEQRQTHTHTHTKFVPPSLSSVGWETEVAVQAPKIPSRSTTRRLKRIGQQWVARSDASRTEADAIPTCPLPPCPTFGGLCFASLLCAEQFQVSSVTNSARDLSVCVCLSSYSAPTFVHPNPTH